MIDDTQGNVRAIRQGMIKYMKRYLMDMDLMKNIVKQNPHAFESTEDIIEQFGRVQRELQAIIDYNFYSVEVEAVEHVENGVE